MSRAAMAADAEFASDKVDVCAEVMVVTVEEARVDFCSFGTLPLLAEASPPSHEDVDMEAIGSQVEDVAVESLCSSNEVEC